jgi:hypothetical protein
MGTLITVPKLEALEAILASPAKDAVLAEARPKPTTSRKK